MRPEQWFYTVPLRLRSLFKRRLVESELDEELRSHIEQATQENQARGMEPAEARRQAMLAMQGIERAKEECRDARGMRFLEDLLQDLRYAMRMLAKSPGFTVVALLTLALGIGANTALFSVVNAVLLNPLPYPHPEQLVTLHLSKPNFDQGAIPFPIFRDWQAQNRSFSAMALSRINSVNLIGAGESEYYRINFITSDFFRILGVEPVLGRDLARGEDEIGGPPLVLISEGLWKRKFGGAPGILGRNLNLSGKLYTVIGVVPANFDLQLANFVPTDFYLPIGQWGNNGLKNRGVALGLHGIGRIKPGVSLEQARTDMDAVSQALAEAFPGTSRGTKANLIPLKRSMTGDVRPVLLLLLGAVGFVLLIACVNVASLLLARSQARTREFAVRAALGARQGRILRQLLTESVLLAVAGGALGLLLAVWGTRAALGLLPQSLPRIHEIHLDARVLLFSLAASVLAGIASGLAPAFKTARPQLQPALQGAAARITAERHGIQRVLVVSEIAAALVLLIGAGLMLRSLTRLWSVDPGFDTHNLLIFNVSLSPALDNAPPAAVRAALRELQDTLAATPAIQAVSFLDGGLPIYSEDDMVFWLSGQPKPRSGSEMNWTLRYVVQPDYLRLMKLPLLRGRFFNQQDTPKSPTVIVVDDVFAATFFPHQDALGQRIRWGDQPRDEAEIVGIVGHVRQWGLDSDDTNSLRAQLYQSFDQLPDDQMGGGVNVGVIARTSGPPLAPLDSLKRRVRRLNAENVVFRAISMEQVVARSLSTRHFSMVLLGGFAILALLLAAVGIYGVIAYVVGRRTQEFGIRMALGAQRWDVLRMVMTEAARIAGLGVAMGVLAAFGLTRAMTKLLFGVKPTDPLTFAAVSALLTLIALAACYLPARRATRVEPMVALRFE